MLSILFKLLSLLPLPVIHGIGVLVGWVSYWSDEKFSRRIRNNLHNIKFCPDLKAHARLVRLNVSETGKGMVETFAIWLKSDASLLKWMKRCEGWQYVEQAIAEKKGIIFLTPHLGCYEIISRYYATKHPITILYSPARESWLNEMMKQGRQHGGTTLAPANLSGVRCLLKALKRGETVGILPDQVPDLGDGVWATYFGQPAYSMNLVSKLVEATNATVLLAYGERLTWGQGYVFHIEPLNTDSSAQGINDAIEQLVRKKPEQYLWSYRRFKKPQLAREKRIKAQADEA